MNCLVFVVFSSDAVLVWGEGERKFDTYIRIANNEIESFVTFPNSFY